MARTRNTQPRWISFDMQELAIISASMENDSEFGAFCRKAISDLRTGCVSKSVDPRVKARYDYSYERMVRTQDAQHSKYTKFKQDADFGDESDDPKAPTSCNASTDADYREKSENTDSAAQAACIPESGTSVEVAIAEDAATSSTAVDVVTTHTNTRHAPAKILDDGKKAYGEFKHVRLTDAEGAKLREIYGADLGRAINMLDNYIENSKKGKAYKNHYAVLRRDNWIYQKLVVAKTDEQRMENAKNGGKSFQERDREAMSKFVQGKSVNHENKVNIMDLTEEEIDNIYGLDPTIRKHVV